MKKIAAIITLFFVFTSLAKAQDTDANITLPIADSILVDAVLVAPLEIDTIPPVVKKTIQNSLEYEAKERGVKSLDSLRIYGWKIDSRFGERRWADIDTTFLNFHQAMLMDGNDVSINYLGNIGSPAQSMIFFERPESSRFMFLDAFSYSRKNPEDQIFVNTKIPYSEIFYQSAGDNNSKEERLMVKFTSNFGKRINLGVDFDYVYARGFYTSLYNKQNNYNLYGSYTGDKYKLHAFFANNNFQNSENGGIIDDIYITNPGEPTANSGFNGETLNIPVHMTETWNRLRGRHVFVTNRYDLGNNRELVQIDDSTEVSRLKKDYIAPASAILTTHYTDQRRHLKSNRYEIDDFYGPTYSFNGINYQYPRYDGLTNDYMSYYSLKNTLSLAMNEGFRDWVKFGLTAFVEYDTRKYLIPEGYNTNLTAINPFPGMSYKESEDFLTIGGVLSKEEGRHLRYKASAEKNIIGSDFRLQGELATTIDFKSKDVLVKAEAYIKGIQPSFFQNKFSSKLAGWNNDFSDTRRVFLGGEINIPQFKTKISGGVENIQNHIYFGPDALIRQNSGNVQILSLKLDQKLQADILHWDNKLVYQATGDEKTIPLPDLSLYSNLYIQTKISKVLDVQLGVDTHIFSKHYLSGYDPLTMQFYNQREKEVGYYPIATAYVNANLKYTRIFLMMYNVADGMGNSESFTTLHYPLNPRCFKMGLSWRFNN